MMPDGKQAIVTGGGTGVGAKIAEALAHARTRVTVMGCREAPLREVAGTVLWLCSDQARSVNGQALSLSGGEI